MKKLEQYLFSSKQQKQIALMAHLVVGYPTLEKTVELARALVESGADVLELQIPFSDPIADGPTIMRACEVSLEEGTKVADAFAVMKTVTKQVDTPVLFMAYFNTLFNYGVREFCKQAAKAGASGLIVPDMPLDEEGREHFMRYCQEFGLYHIHVLSPDASINRVKKNAAVANGFLYCTARQGITGARSILDPSVQTFLQRVRRETSLPLAVGFGISKKEHVDALVGHADMAVIGSAIIDVIKQSEKRDVVKRVGDFIMGFR